MATDTVQLDVLAAKRREQAPQAFARLAIIVLFVGLWMVLWTARIPLPRPFLATLCIEAAFIILYVRVVAVLPSERSIRVAYRFMLLAEIVFHSAMVYFLGGVGWLGAFAYVFGLIFTNTFLDLRGGAVYASGVVAAFATLAILEYAGVVPYYGFAYAESRLHQNGEFLAVSLICGGGALFSIYVWVNWVGGQLRRERDSAVRATRALLLAQRDLEIANAKLETRVQDRTADLQAREDLLQATLASTEDGLLVALGRNIAYVNERMRELWDIPRHLLDPLATGDITRHIVGQISEGEAFLERVRGLFDEPDEQFETVSASDGRIFEVYSRPLMGDGAIIGRVFSFRDVTERHHAESALRERARRDALTGVLNHAAVTDALTAILEESAGRRSVAVAMIDVDGMKAVNDTYGHPVGDDVLRTVAHELARDGVVVGRYGGDEFVAILPTTDRPGAEAFRDGVMEALAAASVYERETTAHIPIVATIGLAVYPDDATSVDGLIRLADNAMYREKKRRPAREEAVPKGSGDRTATLVGELVPLLTSPGDLTDKLRLVSHHLWLGAGYDAVDIHWWDPLTSKPVARHIFAPISKTMLDAWRAAPGGSIVGLLAAAKRPFILKDLARDERLSPEQREVCRAIGMRSGLFVPLVWEDRLNGVLAVGSHQEHAFGARDAHFLTAVATQVTAIVRMATLVDDLQRATDGLQAAQADTTVLLAAAAEAHDRTTGRHLQRVRAVTIALARELGYDDQAAEEMGLAAVLHDIGKIRVPDSILLRPGSLTEEEWTVMKQHTTWGRDFLGDRAEFALAATVALAHHERWDGSGYPLGLAGEAIPEPASIVAVADAFDAITSDRPYRIGRSPARAVEEIVACSGTQFNPRVVDALVRLRQRRRLPRSHALDAAA
jgi:putative two-component system response regulator